MVDIRAVTDPSEEAGVTKVDVLAESDGTLVVNQRLAGFAPRESFAETISSTVVPLANVKNADTYALITVQTNAVRWRIGGVPSTSAGHIAAVDAVIVLENAAEIAAFRAIRDTDTDGALEVSYGRRV